MQDLVRIGVADSVELQIGITQPGRRGLAQPCGAVVELGTASEQLTLFFDDGFGTEFVVWDAESGDVLSRPEGSTWTARDPGGRVVSVRAIPTTTWRLGAGVARDTAYAETWSEVRGGAAVLLCWIPLRQRPGIGTVSNIVVIGLVVGNAITAMARQPEAAGMVRTTMFLGIAFTEALALFGFVLSFIVAG